MATFLKSSKWILQRVPVRTPAGASSSPLFTFTAQELEDFLTKRPQVDGNFEEVEYAVRQDAHWLKCGTMTNTYSLQTILGMAEENHAAATDDEVNKLLSEILVDVTCYQVSFLTSKDSIEKCTSDANSSSIPKFIHCTKTHRGPHSEWIRWNEFPSESCKDIQSI
jgi:hypothetical protein